MTKKPPTIDYRRPRQNVRHTVQRRRKYGAGGETHPEQHRVPPHVTRPRRPRRARVQLHVKQAPAHVHHLPREEERDPGHGRKARCACTEHSLAARPRVVGAACAEIAAAEAEDDGDEGGEANRASDDAVYEHVHENLWMERIRFL